MLTRAQTRRGWRERVWRQDFGAGGSGCSAWIAKPAWQHDPHCPMRTIADISAVATSIPIFNPVYGGWVTVAGTSASAPLVAGVYGLAGNGTRMTTARLYRHRGSFFDITAGDNVFARRCRRAVPTTCAPRRRATTRPPAWARRTGPVVCKGGWQGQPTGTAARPGRRRGPPTRPG